MSRTSPPRRRGFTFIYLLVIIGILAFLASILLPSLCRSREGANRIKCTSNLRQIGLSLDEYKARNNGKLPRTRFDDSARPTPIFYTRPDAPNAFAADGPEPNDVTAALYLLLRWDVTSEVMLCPSSIEERSQQDPMKTSNFRNAESLSYSYQNPYSGKWDAPTSYKAGEFALAADINPGVPELMSTSSIATRTQIIKTNSPNHGGDGQNVLYEDGHAEWCTSPFAGVTRMTAGEPTRDNIYLAGQSGASIPPTIIAAPVDAIDSILLPVSPRGSATNYVTVERAGGVRLIVWIGVAIAATIGIAVTLVIVRIRRRSRKTPAIA
jgi:type II secretory pathway pseudopilin PulG